MAKSLAAKQGSVQMDKAERSLFSRIKVGLSQPGDFAKASWAELKKVHTPSRQETIMLTVRVLVLIGVFGVFLGFTDWAVGSIMRSLLTGE